MSYSDPICHGSVAPVTAGHAVVGGGRVAEWPMTLDTRILAGNTIKRLLGRGALRASVAEPCKPSRPKFAICAKVVSASKLSNTKQL